MATSDADPDFDDPPGSLFVATCRRGVRYTLVCLDGDGGRGGRYAVGVNGRLLPARWAVRDLAKAFGAFTRLSGGRVPGVPAPVPLPTIGLPPAWVADLARRTMVPYDPPRPWRGGGAGGGAGEE